MFLKNNLQSLCSLLLLAKDIKVGDDVTITSDTNLLEHGDNLYATEVKIMNEIADIQEVNQVHENK